MLADSQHCTQNQALVYVVFIAQQPLVGQGLPPHYRGFSITLRHTPLGKTHLDERSARSRDFYRTTHNTHNRQASMTLAGYI